MSPPISLIGAGEASSMRRKGVFASALKAEETFASDISEDIQLDVVFKRMVQPSEVVRGRKTGAQSYLLEIIVDGTQPSRTEPHSGTRFRIKQSEGERRSRTKAMGGVHVELFDHRKNAVDGTSLIWNLCSTQPAQEALGHIRASAAPDQQVFIARRSHPLVKNFPSYVFFKQPVFYRQTVFEILSVLERRMPLLAPELDVK
ncbi:hypothetical protein DIZ76_015657 [Coccidioides immitis]|nr:hypothetical protein DIZ76_015657 [Coccidioides immitis]